MEESLLVPATRAPVPVAGKFQTGRLPQMSADRETPCGDSWGLLSGRYRSQGAGISQGFQEVMEKVFEEHQQGGSTPERRANRTKKHFSRDKKLSSRARVRPAPPPFEANRRGTCLRWLPTLTESDRKTTGSGP